MSKALSAHRAGFRISRASRWNRRNTLILAAAAAVSPGGRWRGGMALAVAVLRNPSGPHGSVYCPTPAAYDRDPVRGLARCLRPDPSDPGEPARHPVAAGSAEGGCRAA